MNDLCTIQESVLEPLAERINAATRSAELGARSAMTCALQAGALLIEAKKLVQHGNWECWLVQHCEVAPRTAQAYMRLAKTVPMLHGEEAQRVADLPVRDAIRAIATDPAKPVHIPAVRAKSKEAAERTAMAFRKSSTALRSAARDIEILRTLKSGQIAALRKKLTDALAALDQIGGAA